MRQVQHYSIHPAVRGVVGDVTAKRKVHAESGFLGKVMARRQVFAELSVALQESFFHLWLHGYLAMLQLDLEPILFYHTQYFVERLHQGPSTGNGPWMVVRVLLLCLSVVVKGLSVIEMHVRGCFAMKMLLQPGAMRVDRLP